MSTNLVSIITLVKMFNHNNYNKFLLVLVQLSLAVVTVTKESNSARKTSGLSIATSNPVHDKAKKLKIVQTK